jgi:hypothetical protein
MKKSEMIDIIIKAVNKRNNNHYTYDAEDHAKEILDEMERKSKPSNDNITID